MRLSILLVIFVIIVILAIVHSPVETRPDADASAVADLPLVAEVLFIYLLLKCILSKKLIT